MSDADDPAQRYLGLWTQYLTALLADPGAMETLKRWVSFTRQFSYPVPATEKETDTPFPVWPPFFGPFGMPPAPPADTSGDRIALLEQRVDALEQRLAKLEPLPETRKARKRQRRSRA